jgi:hypothetical protein
MQPMLIFDKSFLESLNPDEAVWLDNFFATCITPLFFIETLADLEKEVRRGRTPEQVVGNLAYKTPDMNSHMSPYHTWMLLSELRGQQDIALDARIRRADGIVVQLNDQQGLIYRMSKEEEALVRWQRGEFLELERQIAREWRKGVSGIDYSQSYDSFKKLYGSFRKPRNLKDAKDIAETFIDLLEEEVSFRFGMTLLQVPPDVQIAAVTRWSAQRKRPLREFAPYFRYMYGVELFYYLAIGADLISRVRPANKADNKVDIAYLYYLPFCRVFVSNDNLHERVVPLFLREDQTFVKGPVLKADLKKVDEHFDALPEETKAKSLHSFASYPPSDESFLVTRLWDQHSPNWRKEAEKPELSPELQKALLELTKRLSEQSQPIQHPGPLRIEDVQYIHMSRQVFRTKGKWTRVPPEAKG